MSLARALYKTDLHNSPACIGFTELDQGPNSPYDPGHDLPDLPNVEGLFGSRSGVYLEHGLWLTVVCHTGLQVLWRTRAPFHMLVKAVLHAVGPGFAEDGSRLSQVHWKLHGRLQACQLAPVLGFLGAKSLALPTVRCEAYPGPPGLLCPSGGCIEVLAPLCISQEVLTDVLSQAIQGSFHELLLRICLLIIRVLGRWR